MMLRAGELTRLRQIAEQALPDTASAVRILRAPDGAGGTIETQSSLGTFACRVDSNLGRPIEQIGGRVGDYDRSVHITLPYDADIQEGDLITVGSITYLVQSVNAPSWETVKRAQVVQQ